MGVPFEDDDDRRAQLEELGEEFVVKGVSVLGILTETEDPLDVESGHTVQSSLLRLTLVDADVPDLNIGDPVERVGDSARWVVQFPPQRDGTGVVRAFLAVQ